MTTTNTRKPAWEPDAVDRQPYTPALSLENPYGEGSPHSWFRDTARVAAAEQQRAALTAHHATKIGLARWATLLSSGSRVRPHPRTAASRRHASGCSVPVTARVWLDVT